MNNNKLQVLYLREEGIIPDNFTGIIKNQYGDKVWYKDGLLHREDGPTVEYFSGTKVWYKEGDFHREDGPAIERSNGDKEWWKGGLLHREDGPACEYADGDKEWWLNGIEYSESRYKAKLKKLKKSK